MSADCRSTRNPADLKTRLSRALLHFQDRLLEANISSGSLCQVWMPETSEEGEQVLKAKGQPYCAAGVVDLLALFRCISCRYCFSTDISKPDQLGAPGRVFTSRQPEMTRNVQQQSKEVYLRAQEALHCRVHSTLVLPLYGQADRAQVVGILEVIQTTEDMVFGDLVAILSEVLEQCSLYTCDRLQQNKLGKMRPEAAAGAVSATTSKGDNSTHLSASQKPSSHGSPNSIHNAGRESTSPEGVEETSSHLPAAQRLPEVGDHSVRNGQAQGRAMLYAQLTQQQQLAATAPQNEVGGLVRGASDAAAALQLAQAPQTGMVTRNSAAQQKAVEGVMTRASSLNIAAMDDSKISSYFDEEDIGSEDGEGWEDDMEDSAEGAGSADANGRLANRRRGKGTGNPGKPGKKLRLADLQSQFGVGLKEAANKLGICPTTLKRACRRHGIQRWPRRQLARLTRAIDQIRSSNGPNPAPIADRPLRSSSAALVTPPQGSQESAPAGSAGAAQSDPGADTRWSALSQLIPTFSTPLDEGSIHGSNKMPVSMSVMPAPAYEGCPSPALIHQPNQSPDGDHLDLSPPLINAEPEETSELGLQIGLAGFQASEDWPNVKEDPWAAAHNKISAVHMIAEPDSSHMQLDNDSCCMSLGEGMTAVEDETVHGAQAFQRHASLRKSASGLQHLSSGLSSLTNHGLSHHASTGNLYDQGVQIPSSARGAAGLSKGQCLANSHSPHLEEGLLAQSLETHIPMFGPARMPASLPNMAAGTSSLFRTHAGLSMTHLGLCHSHSMASFSNFDSLGHSLRAQRDSQYQHDARSLSAQLCCGGSPGPFDLSDRDQKTHFGEQATPLQPLGGDEMGADMGLMDGDMLEMLLKPE